MDKPTIGHYASHQRDVTAQEDAALNAALRSSTVKVEHPEVASLRAELAKCRRVVAAARAVVSNPMWQGGICDEECELEAAVNALAEKENAKP